VLSLIGKYRHLSKEQIEHIQKKTDARIEILKQISTKAIKLSQVPG
jgi:hypothetical protein